jgi:hypothetical protein
MKKVIWAILELITIAIGTGIFVTNILESYINEEDAGVGAFMVVTGLLLRSWRRDLFSSSNPANSKIEEKAKKDISDKDLTLGILLIFAFTLWGVNYHNTNDNKRYGNSIKGKVNDVEGYAHYH